MAGSVHVTSIRKRRQFAALIAIATALLIYPVRNANDQFNTLELKADANETAVGGSNAAAQKSISAGRNHTCAVTTTGGVKCWGYNGVNALGDGTYTSRYTPTNVSGLSSGVSAIAAGGSHTCALLSTGGVKCWGYNFYGQLGDGLRADKTTPTDVSGLSSGVSAIVAGLNHTCALSSGGVKCWGWNSNGQLGNGTNTDKTTPTDVSGLSSGVSAIAAGETHTCALLSTGRVKCWGSGDVGQLGNGIGGHQTTPVDVAELTDASAISGGVYHTCALRSTGGVQCWGYNNYGQNGDGTTTARSTPRDVSGLSTGVTAITAGVKHTCALLSSGEVKCWGDNTKGVLGDGTTTQRLTPVPVSDLTGVSAITAERHTCALLSSGAVKCWGENDWGALGNNATSTGSNSTPINVIDSSGNAVSGFGPPETTPPTFSSAAVNAAGTTISLTFSEAMSPSTSAASAFTVLVNGSSRTLASVSASGTSVRLGLLSSVVNTDTVTVAYTDPSGGNDANAIQDLAGNDASTISTTSVTNGSTATSSQSVLEGGGMLSAAGHHTCVVTNSGGVKCWGYQSEGGLGDGVNRTTSTPTPVSVVGVSGVASISTGYHVSCAVIAADGQVKCWGRGTYGTLGDGRDTTSTSAVNVQESAGVSITGVTSISGSHFHFCGVLSAGGRVVCWGYNNAGQLGDVTTSPYSNRSRPVQVIESDSTPLTGAVSVAVGMSHSCALLASGQVKCWGAGSNGQLGRGSTSSSSSPVSVVTSSSDSNPLSDVVAVSAGRFHTCAVQRTGRSVCWGWNNKGQLGDGSTTDRTSPVEVSGISGSPHEASAISASKYTEVDIATDSGQPGNHTCVLIRSGSPTGSMKCWGQGVSGQLGFGGKTSSAGDSRFSDVLNLSGVTAMSSGGDHTCALKSDGTVWCWGENQVDQLGAESTGDKNTPGQVVGLSDAGTDTSAPVVSTYTPTDNATGVAVSANLVLGFNENVTAVSGKYLRICTGTTTCTGSTVTGDVVQVYEATNAAITVSSTNVTINPTSDLSGDTTYYVSIDAGAFKDSFNNTYGGLTASTSWNFSTVDTTAPTYSSASTNAAGTEVTLTFNEALSATTAAAGAFSVVVNGTAVTPGSATVSGSTVVLGLTPAVQSGDTVTFTYTDPTAGNDASAVQDSVGNDVASISATSVTNASTVDTRAPTYSSASTSSDGTTITLTYSEALSATTASASAFSVVVDGVSRTVSSVAVSGSTVVLTLASAVSAGASVTVAYTDPSGSNDANAVQDANGNDVATMAATSVTNSVPAPTAPSSGGGGGGGGESPTTTTTTTTTTSTSVPAATSSTTSVPTTTSSTVAVRSGVTTSVPRRTTTSSTIARRPAGATSTSSSTVSTPSTSTTVARVTTTTIFKPLVPLAPVSTIPTTTSSSAIASTTSTSTTIARSVVNNLSKAEEVLEVAKQSANTSVLSAQIAVADLRLKLIDSKSAVAIAIKDAEKLVERLKSSDASPEQIAQAEKRVVDLKIEVAEAKSISIEKILDAQETLETVLANPRSTSVEIAEATAAFIDSRTPSFDDATKILSGADGDPTLPLVIKGVVDNPREGDVVFFDNSNSKSIQVVTLNNSAVRLQSNEGFNLTISSRNTNGEAVALGSNGRILVKHDNTISISGEGFAPNSLAKTWLFSSPRELGAINVNPDGTFAADHPIGKDIKVGLHTAQINGTSPDGEIRSLSISVEVVPNVGPAPFDPLGQPGNVLTLVAELATLLSIAGASSGGGSGAGRRREEEEDDERESAEVAEVSVAFGSVGVDRVRDRLPVLVVDVVDRVSVGVSRGVVGLSPMLARVFGDGVYLRSLLGVLWLVLPFVGAGFGFGAASSAGFDAVMPSLFWLSALVVLGVFDAFSGFVGALVFGLAVGFGGGVVSGDSVRGLLGVWVFCFAAPLIAGAVRPFRRVRGGSTQIVWDRCVDFVLIVLFGAWVAGSMYSALPGLTGFNSPSAGYVNHVRAVVLVALAVRFVLENFAVAVTPVRLKALTREPLPEPTLQQKVVSVIVRTGVYMFVAVVFIGNNWALWLGGVLYLVPKLVSLGVDKLPDMRTVHRYLPRGIFKVVLMLFVAKWWGGLVAAQVDNPADMIKFGFVLLGLPGLALGAVGWFARSSRPWPSTIVTKLLGTALLIIGVLVVLNIWLAI